MPRRECEKGVLYRHTEKPDSSMAEILYNLLNDSKLIYGARIRAKEKRA